ncbi:MAG: putative membrane protein [Psychrobacter okhotskensis]|jgi:uncharacterized membrane protein|uniref:DUF2254 domain-containing protein n=1 Tax=Psychrobacter TaxID=497 RepID=UPI000C348911|nr:MULTISPECIES: DUF2254 domain-containing protein [Psychrobacter]PKG34714.1 DUF2254 domain-containing protein [Psychrobacter sp. Sarcosine-3u-12]
MAADNHTKNTLFTRAVDTGQNGLKNLAQLWSLKTLTDLPDRLKNLWEQLIGSYWFIPTACVLAGILLAPILVTIDEHFDRETVRELSFAFTGDDDAARAIMTAIAGAVLGVAGTTFSITIAVLSMASSQFGPRLLRNFLTDTPNQFVLGAFIGTFSYSLLVLKSIHKYDVDFGVPQLAVTFAIIMAIICALLLVYFVQHMVHAIQASHVIENASNDALKNIHYWYGDHCDIEHQRDIEHHDVEQFHTWLATPIYSPSCGYLQQIYLESLITLTQDYGGVVQLHTNLGHFVTDKNVIGYFYQRPADHPNNLKKTKINHLAVIPRAPDGIFWQRFATCIRLEQRVTHSNDIAYSLGQMTEIAVRALSPGINDPKTAVNCVQSLTTCISTMMRRQPPSPYHFYSPTQDNDETSENFVPQQRVSILAVVTHTPKISDFIDTSLGEIRRYATADLMVLKALCQAMVDLNYARVNGAQQQTLLHELSLVARAGEENLSYSELVNDLKAMCQQAKQFILNDDATHQYFAYMSEFAAHIDKALQTESS